MDAHRANRASMMVPIFSEYFPTMGTRILFGRELPSTGVKHVAAAFGRERMLQQQSCIGVARIHEF